MNSHALVRTIFIFLAAAPISTSAAELKGTVRSVAAQVATIAMEGDQLPKVGDPAEIYFKLAGGDDEISVANGRVEKVGADSVQVKIEKATGDVAKDQSVRITSANPQARGAALATATPTAVTATTTATAGAANVSTDLSFAFVDLNSIFKNLPRMREAESRINVAKNAAKIEYDRKVAAKDPDAATWRANKEKQLQDDALQVRGALVEEIVTMVKSMAGEVNLVFDSSGMSANGMGLTLFTPKQADLTANVSSALANARPGAPSPGWRNLNVAQVEMNRVFRNLNRTKDAETKINQEKNAARQEYDKRVVPYKKLFDSLSSMKAGTQREKTIARLRAMETEINSFRVSKEKQLQETALKLREGIVQTMNSAVAARVKGQPLPLIFETSGMSKYGNPIFLFVSGLPDFSDGIIAEVNGPAQGNAAASETVPSTTLKIACIDLERVLSASAEGKQIKQEMDALTQQAEAELATADAAKREAKTAELGDLSKQKSALLVAKAQSEIARIARAENYNLVLNSSARSFNDTPWLITSNHVVDLSDAVFAALSK